MPTREEWECALKALFRTADRSGSGSGTSHRLTRALASAGVYDIRVIRNALAEQVDLLEMVQGCVVDQNGREHAFEARRLPFELNFRWTLE